MYNRRRCATQRATALGSNSVPGVFSSCSNPSEAEDRQQVFTPRTPYFRRWRISRGPGQTPGLCELAALNSDRIVYNQLREKQLAYMAIFDTILENFLA